MRLLLALAALALCAAPLQAEEKSQSLNLGHGIICNTSEQALRFVMLRNEGSETPQAIQLINREAADPTACGAAMIVYRVDEEVHKERLNGEQVTVTKVVISAISDGVRWSPVPDIVQYALVVPDGIEV